MPIEASRAPETSAPGQLHEPAQRAKIHECLLLPAAKARQPCHPNFVFSVRNQTRRTRLDSELLRRSKAADDPRAPTGRRDFEVGARVAVRGSVRPRLLIQ